MYNSYGEQLEYVLHEAEREDVMVVIGHGLTGNMDREMCVYLATKLAEQGYPTLRFSYSGHGGSGGKFEEMTITKVVGDLQVIIDQFRGKRKLAFIGHSMGAAVGALTAAKGERIDVLISLAGMVHTLAFYEQEFSEQEAGNSVMWDEPDFPLSIAFKEDLTNIKSVIPAVQDLRIPWLLIHGAADDVVLPKDSLDLMKHLKGEKKHVSIEGSEHLFDGYLPAVFDAVNDWLGRFLRVSA